MSAAVAWAGPSGRYADWPERLAAFIELRRHVPFAWGVNDCALFAADACLAISGFDPLRTLRGQWANELQAMRFLAQLGGVAWAARKALGRPLVGAVGAPRGAVVCARMNGLAILGVHLGACWCAPGAAGLEFRPAREVRLAWGV